MIAAVHTLDPIVEILENPIPGWYAFEHYVVSVQSDRILVHLFSGRVLVIEDNPPGVLVCGMPVPTS